MPLADALAHPPAPNRVSQFCHLPDFLDAAQLERWRSTLDVAVARRARRMPLASDADNTNSPMYTQRCGLRLNDAELNRLTFAAGAVAGSAACTLNDHPAGFRLYLDNVLIKEPWGDPTRWHVDTFSFTFNSTRTSSFWIVRRPPSPPPLMQRSADGRAAGCAGSGRFDGQERGALLPPRLTPRDGSAP